MTQSLVSPHIKAFWNSNTFYVSKNGLDTNNGAIDTPFLTIGAAVTAAASGDAILVGRGTYAEQLVINKSLYVSALVPGSVYLQIAVNAASALTVAGTVANQRLHWEGINIVNTDNTGAAAIALTITGGGVAGHYVFRHCTIQAGISAANAATAVSFTGNVGNPTLVDIDSPLIMGAHLLTIASAGDVFIYRNCGFERGPAIWMRITGGVAGWVKIINSVMAGLTGTEYIEFGNAAATAAIVNIIGSRLNAYLRMNTTGTGYAVVQNSSVSYATYNQVDQVIHYQNGDKFTVTMYNINLNANAPHTMYTVPAGRTFEPDYVTTTNRGANSGVLLVFRYNGSGNGTIVAAVGAAALNRGTRVQTVLKDHIAAAGTVQFEVTTASGAANVADATVTGRLC